MARRRFAAPPRERTDPARFDHPAFNGFAAHRDLLLAPSWPGLATLNARLGAPWPAIAGAATALFASPAAADLFAFLR